jgi:hypothetical protein
MLRLATLRWRVSLRIDFTNGEKCFLMTSHPGDLSTASMLSARTQRPTLVTMRLNAFNACTVAVSVCVCNVQLDVT